MCHFMMTAKDAGEVFIHEDINAGRIELDQCTKNHDVPEANEFEDNASCFTTNKMDSKMQGISSAIFKWVPRTNGRTTM